MIKPLNPKWMTSKTRNSMKVKTEKCLRPIKLVALQPETWLVFLLHGSKNRFGRMSKHDRRLLEA